MFAFGPTMPFTPTSNIPFTSDTNAAVLIPAPNMRLLEVLLHS